jgi:hypothetical protein
MGVQEGVWPRRLAKGLPACLWLGLPALLILGRVGPGGMLYGRDWVSVFYYTRLVVSEALASGRLPVWEPGAMIGFPLLAAVQAAVFYPATWIGALLPAGAGWTWLALLHMSLSGFLAAAWLQRGLGLAAPAARIGGCFYMLSFFFVGHLHAGHVNYIWAFPWVVGTLWRLERCLVENSVRAIAALAACFALLVLAGAPQISHLLGVVGVGRLAWHLGSAREARSVRWRAVGRVALAGTAGLLLAAPQLLPSLELIPHLQRSRPDAYAFATDYSFPPENLITLLAPRFLGSDVDVAYWGRGKSWELGGFMGLAALALGLVGLRGRHPQRWFWAGLALAGLLLALGRYAPFFRAWYHLVPGAGLFRGPSRLLLLFTIGVAALSALGADRLWTGGALRSGRAAAFAGSLAVLLSVTALAFTPDRASRRFDAIRSLPDWESASESPRPRALAPEAAAAARGSLAWAASGALLLAAAFGVHAAGRLPSRGLAGVLGLLGALELGVQGRAYFRPSPEEFQRLPAGLSEFLRGRGEGPFRVASAGDAAIALVGSVQAEGLAHVGGYDPMMLRSYAELMNVVHGKPADEPVVAISSVGPHPVLDMLGARYWLVSPGLSPPPSWRALATVQGRTLFENPAALPRAWLVREAVVVPESERRLGLLASETFDPRAAVLLESGATGSASVGGGGGQAFVLRSRPGELLLRIQASAPSWLVVSEVWYPGWEAWVDGRGVQSMRANHLLQALPVHPGTHEVRLRYRSRWLGWGLFLGAVTMAGLLTACVRRGRAPSGEAGA